MLDLTEKAIKTLTENTEMSGEGSFSKVWLSPDNKAIKVCTTANSDAWLWYGLLCLAVKKTKTLEVKEDQIPLDTLLDVHGIRLDIEKNEYVASMEVLQEPKAAGPDNMWKDDEDFLKVHRPAQNITDELCDLSETCLTNDVLTRHNYMRGSEGRVVLTDPVCYNGWRYIQGKGGWRTHLKLFAEAVEKYKLQDYIEIV